MSPNPYGSYTRRGRSSPRNTVAQTRLLLESGMYGERVEKLSADGERTRMGDLNREEVKARLETAEARIATAVESMRADAAELRSDLHTGLEQMKAQGMVAQANADKFYAQAGSILADSKTLLAEIRQAGEKNRADMMGMGYKALTWIFGAALTLCGLYFTIKKAVTPVPAPSPAVSAPNGYPSAQPMPPTQMQAPPSSTSTGQ